MKIKTARLQEWWIRCQPQARQEFPYHLPAIQVRVNPVNPQIKIAKKLVLEDHT